MDPVTNTGTPHQLQSQSDSDDTPGTTPPDLQSQSDSDEPPQKFSRSNPNPVLKDRFFFDFVGFEPTIKWNRNQMEIDKVYLVQTFIDWLNGKCGESSTFTIHRESYLDEPHKVDGVDQGYTKRGHHYGSNYDGVNEYFHNPEYLEGNDKNDFSRRFGDPEYRELLFLLTEKDHVDDPNPFSRWDTEEVSV